MFTATPFFSACCAARIDPPAASQKACTSSGEYGIFKLHFFPSGKRPGFQLLNVMRGVDEKDVLIRCRLRRDEVGTIGNSRFDQLPVHAPIFLCRENMLADRQIIFIAVDKLEREHEELIIINDCHPELAR